MRRAAAAAFVLALAACTATPKPPAAASSSGAASPSASVSSPAPTRTPATAEADWPEYHQNAARTGVALDQRPIGRVRRTWTASLDADVYAEPLVSGARVIVATENDSLYSLDAHTGKVGWRAHLGTPVQGGTLPCGNISPSGITGTPVIDAAARAIYAVAFLRDGPHHELFSVALDTGAVNWHRAIDPPGLSPAVEQERGALAISDGRVYVPFGGLQGDCGAYKGAVVSSATDGTGAVTSYVVPTQREGGIWNPAGPAVDATGSLWVTTGNTNSSSTFDYGNAVLRLTPALKVRDYFAPTDWRALNNGDTDLGTVGVAFMPGARVFVAGKSGIGYVMRRDALGHIGGEIARADVCTRAFGQAATSGDVAYQPCESGLAAIRVASDRIHVVWTRSGGTGPAILAAGLVWSLAHDGTLRALDPRDGATRFSTNLPTPVSRFIPLSAGLGSIFVPSRARVVAFALR